MEEILKAVLALRYNEELRRFYEKYPDELYQIGACLDGKDFPKRLPDIGIAILGLTILTQYCDTQKKRNEILSRMAILNNEMDCEVVSEEDLIPDSLRKVLNKKGK